jgi:hypothetical protein
MKISTDGRKAKRILGTNMSYTSGDWKKQSWIIIRYDMNTVFFLIKSPHFFIKFFTDTNQKNKKPFNLMIRFHRKILNRLKSSSFFYQTRKTVRHSYLF